MEHRGPRPDQARAPPKSFTACAKSMRRRGLQHFGQGKWYPGEQLPRWSLNCFWRRDGQPCGTIRRCMPTRPRLRRRRSPRRALPAPPRRAPRSRPEVCLSGLRGCLLLPVARAPPAGQRRPLSIPASTTRSNASAWPRSFARALDKVVGYVLPLKRRPQGAGRAASGSCAAGAAIWCPAIRRSAIACRSTRSPGWPKGLSVHPRARPDADFPATAAAGRDPRAGGRQPQREPLPSRPRHRRAFRRTGARTPVDALTHAGEESAAGDRRWR
jgi:uncharacterized protein (DUF2126 family)